MTTTYRLSDDESGETRKALTTKDILIGSNLMSGKPELKVFLPDGSEYISGWSAYDIDRAVEHLSPRHPEIEDLLMQRAVVYVDTSMGLWSIPDCIKSLVEDYKARAVAMRGVA